MYKRQLEDKIAALEHGTGALAFASGIAAATTAVLTACKAGSHVVCLHNAYGPLKDFLSKYCRADGKSAKFVFICPL